MYIYIYIYITIIWARTTSRCHGSHPPLFRIFIFIFIFSLFYTGTYDLKLSWVAPTVIKDFGTEEARPLSHKVTYRHIHTYCGDSYRQIYTYAGDTYRHIYTYGVHTYRHIYIMLECPYLCFHIGVFMLVYTMVGVFAFEYWLL